MFTPKSVTVLSLVALGFAPVAVEADVLFAESFETTDVGNLPTDWQLVTDNATTKGAGLSPLWQGLPEAVEVVRREGERATLWFVINRGDQPVEAPELPTGHELLSERGSTALASRLSPWEVRVIAGV